MQLIETKNKKGIGLSITSIIFGILILVFLVLPKLSDYSAKKTEANDAEEVLAKLTSQSEEANISLQVLDQVDNNIALLNTAIPDKADLTGIYAYLEQLANASNLKFSALQGIEAGAKDEKNGNNLTVGIQTTPEGVTADSPSPTLGVVIVNMDLKGKVLDFEQFLRGVQKSMRIMDVQTIEISADSEEQVTTFRLSLKTYYQKAK